MCWYSDPLSNVGGRESDHGILGKHCLVQTSYVEKSKVI